jgi:hypothetical protein
VTINISTSGDSQVSTSPGGSLSFNSTNWGDEQTVTVTAIDDIDYEANPHTYTITQTATGSDYTGVPVASVPVNITDNDPAQMLYANASSNAPEQTSPHTITVTLIVPGGGTLLAPIVATVTDAGGGTATAGVDYALPADPTVTFNAGDATDATKNVNLTIMDDGATESNETFRLNLVATSGHVTTSPSPQHIVTIVDDESNNILVTPTASSTVVSESGTTDTFAVTLTQAPIGGDVTVNLAKTAASDEFSISPTQLTFTSSTWNQPHNVTVTPVDDDFVDGTQNGEVTLTGSGPGYNGVDATTPVSITDDDTAGVTIAQTGGSTAVTEGGAADTYTVKLNARPTSNVTVTFTYDNTELGVSPSSLIFTTNNWSTTQTVSVTGVADGVAEVTETHTIQHTTTSADTPFSGLAVASVSVEVTNSDELQVSIDGPTVGATGVAATFMGVENASGTGPIVYDWSVIDIDNGNRLLPDTGSTSTFTFTPPSGGHYGIVVAINDDVSDKDFFIKFTALGDLGGSIFTSDILWLAEEGITRGCNPPENDAYCPTAYVTRGQMAAFLVRFLGLTAQNPAIDFTDDDGSIFEDNIEKLATAGITKGCNPSEGNTKFCPNNYVTRGQMAAFLVRALNLTDDGDGNLFTDDDDSIFESNIDVLATAGITKGCNPSEGNTKFCPNGYVTRGQMAAFLHRAEGLLP